MKYFDSNKDGKMDFKEFSAMVVSIDKKLPEDEMKLMFEYLDADKSGWISVNEFKPVLS